jgi:hypothetical protein
MSESSSSAATSSSTGTSEPDIVFVYLHGIISEDKSRRGKYEVRAEFTMRKTENENEDDEITLSAQSTLDSLVVNALKPFEEKHQDTESDHRPDLTKLLEAALPGLVTEARELHPEVNFGASLIRFEDVEATPKDLQSIAEEEEEPDAGEVSEGEEGSEEGEGSQDNERSEDKDDSVAGSDTGSKGQAV